MKKFFARIFFKCYDFFAKIPKKTYETCAIILLAVVLVVDLGYHLITSVSDKLETAPAKVSSLSETLSLDALILRDEMPLEFDGDRYLVLREDGERVNIGAELIRVYPQSASEEDLAALSAEMLLQKILLSADGARLDKIRDAIVLKIEGKTLTIEEALKSGNLIKASREEGELHALFLLRERLLGTVSLERAIQENTEAITRLEARLGKPVSTLTSPAVGWFSTVCDGFETLLSSKDVYRLTQSELLSLFDKEPKTPPKAKLILSHETLMLSSVSETEARDFSQNSRYAVTLDHTDLTLTLKKTVFENQSPRVALIFSDAALSKTVSLRRISPLTLTVKVHEGFKIPTAAIAEENGVYGVYILKGFRVEFREISIIYRDGNIAVCEKDFTPVSYRSLAENDNVIIKGDELYDGKIVSRLY